MSLSLSNRPWYIQIGAFVVLAAGACVGFWRLYVTEMRAGIAMRQARIVAIRSDLAKGSGTARRRHAIEAEVRRLEQRLDSLKAVLPEPKDVADILRRVQGLATQSTLAVQRFTPQPAKTQALYVELPYRLQAEGAYHNLGGFLDKISKLDLLVDVREISIKATPQQQPTASIVAEYVASTFVLQEAKGPRPPSSAVTARPGYSYEVAGRRDPFVSLIAGGAEPKATASRPPGLAGVLIGEIGVTGIMRDRTGFIGMLQGPDNRTYTVRSGERLLDGSVKSVTADSVAFVRDVNEPPSTVKQREIVKKLRGTRGGGQ